MTTQAKTRLDESLIAALLAKPSVAAAAKGVGISTRTAQRRMTDPEFEQKFRAAKVRLIREATNRLTVNASKAADVLRKVFDDRKATPAARVSAAANTIRLSLEAFEVEDLERRIRALEGQSSDAI